MDLLVLTLRVVHILLGVFWAGTLIFAATFLMPSIRDAGPDGAKVVGALIQRRYLDVMPVVAGLTVLSGLWLYWRLSGGLSPAWIHSPVGTAYGLGGLAAILAFVIGVAVMRPATLRIAALARAIPGMPDGPEKVAQQAEVARLREKAASASRTVALLLGFSVVGMAVARYL
jgi:hypothetical protein